MHHKLASSRNGVLALTAIAVLSVFASAAFAGDGKRRGHKKYRHDRGGDASCSVQYRQSDRVYVRQPQRVAYARPAYEACAPRYVSYRPQGLVIVRPAPYVRVGGRIGSVDISAVFGSRRQYSNYDYGCNFCNAHYTSYSSYERHVQSCEYRPANVRIQSRRWDDAGYDDYRRGGYRDRDYGDRSNDGYDDRGYDDYDRDDDGYYD